MLSRRRPLSYLLLQKGAARPVRADDETVRQRLIWVRVLLLETTRAQIIIIARRKSPGVQALDGATQHEAVEGARTFEAHIVSL